MPHCSNSATISTADEHILLMVASFNSGSPNPMVSSMCDSGEISPSEVAKPATDGGVIVPGAWWIITVFAPES